MKTLTSISGIIEKFSLCFNKVRCNSWQAVPSILPVTFSGHLSLCAPLENTESVVDFSLG